MNISSQLRSVPLLSLTLAGVVGCIVPESVGDAPDTNVTATTEVMLGSTGMSSSSDSPDGTSTRAAGTSTGDPGTGSGTDSTTGEPVASVCDPQPEGISMWGRLAPARPPVSGTNEVDADCEVLAIDASDGYLQIDLDCGADPISFELQGAPPLTLPLMVGEIVHTRIHEHVPIDYPYYLFLALSGADGQLRLGFWGNASVAQQPPGFDQWLTPLQLELVGGVCDPEPYVPPSEGRSFIVEPCSYQEERMAFDVSYEGDRPQRIFDEGSGIVQGYEVWVARALTLYPQTPECGPGSVQSATVLLVAPP